MWAFKPFQFSEVIAVGSDEVDGAGAAFPSSYPKPRRTATSVCDESNLYIFGGDADAESIEDADRDPCLGGIWRLNFAINKWNFLPTDGTPPLRFGHHCANLVGWRLVVFGGADEPVTGSVSNKVYSCDLGSLKWEQMETTGDSPIPQYGHAGVLDKVNQCIYVLEGTVQAMNVFKIGLQTKTWELLASWTGNFQMPSLLDYSIILRHQFAFDGKNIYLFQGIGEFPFQVISTFNLDTRTWAMLQSEPETDEGLPQFPKARSYYTAAQFGDAVYLCGGGDHVDMYDDIWRFHVPTRTWKLLPIKLPIPLFGHTASVTPQGCMYLFGGLTSEMMEVFGTITTSKRQRAKSNRVFKMWLTVPTLKEMCWEALCSSTTQIGKNSRSELLDMGIPEEFVKRVHFPPSQ